MVFIDSSILNVAFRDLVADYGIDKQRRLTWVFSAYSIAFAAALLTAGRVGDRFGRKRAFLGGVLGFAAASVLCATSTSVELLIAARVLQAFAGAFVVPSALALVLPEFPPEKRSMAIGVSGAVGGLSAVFGPVVGGVLVDQFGWRSVFYINVPISALAVVAGWRVLRDTKDESATTIPDPLGGLMAIIGFGLLTATIVEGDAWGWGSIRTLAAIAISFALLTSFVIRSKAHPVPVVDLSLFKLRFFSAANLSSFLFSAGFFAMFFTNVSFLQTVFRYGPTRSGFASACGPLMAAIVAAPAGAAATRRGHKVVIALGLSAFASGVTLTWAFAGYGSNYWTTFFPAMTITGFGVGLTISTLGSASNAFLPPHRFGMGSAVHSTGRQIGAGMGIAAVSAIRLAAPKDDLISGYRNSWLFAILMALLALIAMLTLFRKPTFSEIEASRVPMPVPA